MALGSSAWRSSYRNQALCPTFTEPFPSFQECQELDIPFHLLIGFAQDVLPAFVTDHGLGGVVTDFSPLRIPMQWVEDVKERLPGDVPFVQVGVWAAGEGERGAGGSVHRPFLHAGR